MLKYLTYGLLLLCLNANAQYFSASDFHSEFERKAFEQLLKNKPIDPASFLVSADKNNNFVQYGEMAMLIKTIPSRFTSSKYANMEFEKKLKSIFKFTQRQYFKRYRQYHSYSDLIENGSFNCISGTAFYALLLKEMGYNVHIYETPHHAYLEVEKENGNNVLIESTDAAFGVVDKMKKVEARRVEYAQGESEFIAKGFGNAKHNPEEIFTNEINLLQLAGLQYYNQAVVAFNIGEFETASTLLKKAAFLYPSSRIIMLQLLSDKLIASNY